MPLRYETPNLLAVVTAPARAFGVNYTNNRNRPIMVIVSVDHQTTNPADQAAVIGFVDAVGVSRSGYDFQLGKNANMRMQSCMTFMVPAGSIYQVGSQIGGLGVNTLFYWREIEL